MAEDTMITIVGNAVEVAELRFTPQGVAVARFRVASTPRYLEKQTNTWQDGEALFLSVQVWRQMAEYVAESITKGTRVIVHGKLKMRSYEAKDGSGRRTAFEVDADEVGPSLRYATAKVQKMSRSSSGGQSGGGDDPWATAAPASADTSRSSGFADEPPF
jgi:single-strand DNA-binding protein